MSIIERLSNEFRQDSEGIATELRAQLGLRAFDPLPVGRVASHLKATLITPQDLPSLTDDQVAHLLASTSWSAAVIRHRPLWIVYHPQHTPARHQSDLMHEFAHVLLSHPMVGIDPHTGLPQRRPQDEDEATYLGGCLQIPRRGLLWAVQRHMSLSAISTHFGASEEMVRFRGNVVGIVCG
jgi:hypothetical protein